MTKLIIGEDHNRLTESEKIAILKEKNGTRTTNNDLAAPASHLYGLNHSITGGISKDIWMTRSPEIIQLRNILETYFVSLFDWQGLEDDFRREMESILFRYGQVAVIKLPSGDIYPAQFSIFDDKKDYYGNPLEIEIKTDNEFNGTRYTKDNFVILYNNHVKEGTLTFMYERMRQFMRALRDIDNNSVLSRPKWGANVSANDAAWVDITEAMNSDLPIVPLGNIDFKEAGITPLSGDDQSDSKLRIFKFQLTILLKMIGLKSNFDEKAERQTELEVARNDEFDSQIFKDMYEYRQEKVEMLNALGLQVSLETNELIEGISPEKDEVNGEENKKIVGEDNE